MLTLEHHYKLCQKPVGKMGWKVMYSSEYPDYYEIALEHKHISSVYVRLQRNKTTMSGRKVYRFTDSNGIVTTQGVTADYITDINNFLKALSNLLPS